MKKKVVSKTKIPAGRSAAAVLKNTPIFPKGQIKKKGKK